MNETYRRLLESELPPLLLGGVLELGEELGRGGMGTVFRGRHLRLGRPVAVKFLHDVGPDAEARFEREARALALLAHPNIVQVFDYGREEGQPFIVMELVEGRPLAAHIPLAPERAVAIGLQVCDALVYAHGRGLVHRDIKPENILLDASGQVKVTDFGIARLAAREQGWTVTGAGQAAGTPHFVAPEVLEGARPDPRQDVYALGVVLYQLVTGRLPVGNFEPLPGDLDRVVRAALAPDPARRTPSAAELRRQLAALRLTGDELPDDERFWMRGAAMLSAAAGAVAIWAGMVSVTPRVVEPGAIYPLSQLVTEPLPDGRLVSWARFEIWPTLGALAALALAFTALGILRRHWRVAGFDTRRPERPLAESRAVLYVGIACSALWLLRIWLQARGALGLPIYAPLLGGLLELAFLYTLFTAMLEAWRTGRPLRREPLLFVGSALALAPPAIEFFSYVLHWRP